MAQTSPRPLLGGRQTTPAPALVNQTTAKRLLSLGRSAIWPDRHPSPPLWVRDLAAFFSQCYDQAMAAISTIRNLGPAMEAAFKDVGITTAEDLRSLGPDAAYGRLLENGHRPHFIGYYVLVMGLQGRPWNDCKGKEKAALRERFDALKAQRAATPQATLWKDLQDLGIVGASPDEGGGS